MFKAFVYRLYPSKSQRKRLEAVRETCRHFYNDCRRERKEAYEQRGETISQTVQLRKVKIVKATSPYALEIHSHILQNVVADLDKAFQAFFRKVKAGENPGYPRLKVRNRFAGFGFKEYGNGFKIDGRRLYLFGIGRIAVRWHRKLEGTIKTARIFCRAGKWFVAFSCEVEKLEPLPRTGESIGIDLGLMRLATFSNGEKKENPRWYRDCSIILGVFSSQNGPDAGPSWSVRDRAPADPAACPGRYAGECVQPSALSRCSFVPCDSAGYFVPPHCWSPAGVCHPGTSAPSPSSGWKACPEPGPAACTGSRVPVAEPVEPAPSPSGSGGRTIGRPPP